MMPSAGAVSQAGSRIRGREVGASVPAPSRWAYPQHRGGAGHSGPYHSAGLIGQTRWFSATMGSMSASDAAPLPRLGEVFFDVRGNSRSMRLSWYADTGVAVFSIWQGGTCTGTFRLPMDDLARMIESLRRGPQGQRAGRREAPGEAGRDGRAARRAGGPGGPGPRRGPGDHGHADACRVRRALGPAPGQLPAGLQRRTARARSPATGRGPADYGTGPERATGDSGSYPIDPLDPAYPVPAARYPDEPATGSYRRPAQEYGPAAGYPADPGYTGSPATGDYRRAGAPGYHDLPATGDYRSGQSGSHRRDPGDFPERSPRAQVRDRRRRGGVSRGGRPRRIPRPRLPGRAGHGRLPHRPVREPPPPGGRVPG